MAGSSRLVSQMSNGSAAVLTQILCRRPDAGHRQMPKTTSFGRSGRLFGDSVGLASWSAGGGMTVRIPSTSHQADSGAEVGKGKGAATCRQTVSRYPAVVSSV